MKNDIRIDSAQLVELLDAAFSADFAKIKRIGGELAQQCSEQGDNVTAKGLRGYIRRKGVPLQLSGAAAAMPVDGGSRLPLIEEEPWPAKPIILNQESRKTVERFLHDVRNAHRLYEGGLLTRFGLMLSGPPGTGKTLLAGHIAAQLKRPFLVARLDSLISSRLGETAKNIRQIFDFAPANGAVLFLDELDAIAKMRDDRHELGELKRVVNTVIQGLDSLDDQSVVIAATNHPQLLDHAIWRRFPYRCDISFPNEATRAELWLHFLYSDAVSKRNRAKLLSHISDGLSGADIENLALATRRLALLNEVDLPEPQLLWALAESSPPKFHSPDTEKLTREQKAELVHRFAGIKGVTKIELADMIGTTRQTVYRKVEEGRHE